MKTDTQLAKSLIKIRETGYPNPLKAMFGMNKLQMIRPLAAILLLFLAITNADHPFLGKLTIAMFSFSIGILLSEFKMIIRIAKSWPFSEKITNWELVEKIAEDKE